MKRRYGIEYKGEDGVWRQAGQWESDSELAEEQVEEFRRNGVPTRAIQLEWGEWGSTVSHVTRCEKSE